MAGIPVSTLRRALATFSRDSGRGATLGFGAGFVPPAIEDLGSDTPGAGFGGALQSGVEGALMGGVAGGYGGAAIRGGARLVGGLRQALAEAAAERGIGRAATREASHADDAARFAEASRGPMGGATPNAEDLARQIREMSQGQPSGTVEAMVRQIGDQDPQLGRQVMEILMGQSPY
jgi:hypothetical protein